MSKEAVSESFCIQYYPYSQLQQILDDDKVFTVFQFDRDTEFNHDDPRIVTIALPQFNKNKLIEVWTSYEPVTQRVENECIYQVSDSFLFISILIDESRFENITLATRYAYQKVTELKEQLGYIHNTRMWNYFPDINEETLGQERYKQFCEGRHEILADKNNLQKNFSAATAIGSQGPGLMVLSLSTRQPVSHVENPQQISAYLYPRNYGRKSPSFARATSMTLKMADHLYVSGTASIIGHQSQYQCDVKNQTRLSLDNIEALLNHAKRENECFPVTLDNLTLLKVYIRQAEDFQTIKTIMQQRTRKKTPIVYLHGDICRKELLVEVEGLYIQNCNNTANSR